MVQSSLQSIITLHYITLHYMTLQHRGPVLAAVDHEVAVVDALHARRGERRAVAVALRDGREIEALVDEREGRRSRPAPPSVRVRQLLS